MTTRTRWSFQIGCHRFVYLRSFCSVLDPAHEALLKTSRINKTRSRDFGLRRRTLVPLLPSLYQ